MWFKNLQPYRLTETLELDLDKLNAAMAKQAFVPIGKSDLVSEGWTAPAPHAPDLLAYRNAGAVLIALKTEEKILPASVVKQVADDRAAEIEEREFRKIGKKERKEIRERVAEELLPRAFSRSRVTRALVEPQTGWVWVDTSSASRAETLLSLIREALEHLPSRLLHTQQSPVTVMTNWLENGADEGFTLDADCELKAPGDEGAVIRCRRQDLNAEEIRNHLAAGKLVTQLALSWADRVSFVLTDKLQIKRLAMLDLLQDQLKDTDAGSADLLFDATLTLLVGELRGLMTDLVVALGGEEGAPDATGNKTSPAPN